MISMEAACMFLVLFLMAATIDRVMPACIGGENVLSGGELHFLGKKKLPNHKG